MADGPTRETCDAVDERDGYACIRCGVSLFAVPGSRHHRKRRRVGGHAPSNLVLLCGSGTTGCHGWAHGNPREARICGLIVPTWIEDPAAVPVLTLGGWRLLEGTESRRIDGPDAVRLMEDLGLFA